MESVMEIEEAIERLTKSQMLQLMEWLEKKTADSWDLQFEKEVKSGKLDAIAEKAIAAHRSGQSKTFPDVTK